jgi:hypothetical protein
VCVSYELDQFSPYPYSQSLQAEMLLDMRISETWLGLSGDRLLTGMAGFSILRPVAGFFCGMPAFCNESSQN